MSNLFSMKLKMILVLAMLICFISSFTATAQTICDNEVGTQGSWTYEYWKDQGTGCMVLGDGGSFSCDWSNINNLLARKGLRPGSMNQVVNYTATYNPNGNSYLCVYGWTKSPLVEYYIVDSWGTWRPPGGEGLMGTVNSDGGTYDIYRTQRVEQPSIEGTATFYQFWSVRTSKKTSGTITCGNHFSAWAGKGMSMGNLYEVSFCVEGYQSSGTANITSMSMTTGGTDPTTPPTETTAPTTAPNETPAPTAVSTGVPSTDCSNAPTWTADAIYETAGTRVVYNGNLYENNWYSQGQNPEQNSGEFQVWTLLGSCDSSQTPMPTTAPTDPPVQTTAPTDPPVQTTAPTVPSVATQTPQPGAGDVWIDPSSLQVGTTQSFTIQILANTGSQILAAYGFNVTYPSTMLSIDTSVDSDGVEAGVDGFVAAVNSQNAGSIIISGFDATGTGPGASLHINTVYFTAGQNAGTADLGLTINDFADNNTDDIGVPNGTGGTVTITDVLLGDTNGNGSIDIVDALLLAQYYVDLNPSGFNPAAADTNCNGSIDIVDALLIAQYYVDLINSFC